MLLEYALGLHTTRMDIGQYCDYLANIIPITMLYLAIKEKRDKVLGGTLTFGQGMKTGVLISLITAAIVTIFWYVYLIAINPLFIELGIEFEKNKMVLSGMSEADVAAKLGSIKSMYSLPMQLGAILIFTPIVGSIYTAIISAILRKKLVLETATVQG